GGCEFHEIETGLVDYGLLDDDDYEVSRPVAVRHSDPRSDELKIDHARRLYEAAWRDDPIITAYLRSRAISVSSSVLRFQPQASHRIGVRLPAMLAPVTNIVGEITGTHLTYLKPDGSGLAFPKPDKSKGGRDLRRQCEGVIRGGAIRLAPYSSDQELIVAEGGEGTLSAMGRFNLPGWSAVRAGGLTTVKLPTEARWILIVADNDQNGCGQRNAVEAARQWKAEGRMVRIWMPETLGDDANDFLIKKRRA